MSSEAVMSQKLQGKVIVITGASSGFGKGAARKLAAEGASLVLAARRGNLLEDLARECEAAGGRAMAIPTDVSKPEEVERLAGQAVSAFGRFDVWVNDAGVGAVGRFEDIPVADHTQVVLTNVLGTMYGSHAALLQFRKQGTGTLINIASALGKIPAPYYASYTATKYAIVGLSAALRQELRQNKLDNVHVCTVMPMAMDTPFFDHAANYSGHEAAPVPPLYDPELVIDVIVRMVDKPEDEVIVGTAGKIANAVHSIFPGLTENLLGGTTHKAQIKVSPVADPTHGAVHEPSSRGTEVYGGRLKK
jgi:short-subunit dehydrogenase